MSEWGVAGVRGLRGEWQGLGQAKHTDLAVSAAARCSSEESLFPLNLPINPSHPSHPSMSLSVPSGECEWRRRGAISSEDLQGQGG